MRGRLLINDLDKLKITLVRYWRINFRYNNQLYSLQHNDEDYEDVVYLNMFKNNKWEYINSINCVSLSNLHIIKMKNGKEFKNNIIYSHIDKQLFLKELHQYGLINAGNKIELECLYDELKMRQKLEKDMKRRYQKDIQNSINIRKEIQNKINKILKEEGNKNED